MNESTVTEADIRERVGAASFARGRRYYEQGAIVKQQRQGNILRARCHGSQPQPYLLWIQLGPEGIVAGDCSCPVGGGAFCKHAAALLLTWLHLPDTFQETDSLEESLEQREKADLILLIRQMVARYPDLEDLIELYPPGTSSAAGGADAELLRRQINQAFDHADYGNAYYRASTDIANELNTIMQRALPYREQGDWLNAAVIYRTVLDELRAVYMELNDHHGDLGSILGEGSEQLGECLSYIEQPEARLEILGTLLDILTEDISAGGYGFADGAYAVLLEQVTDEEIPTIVSRLEEELARVQTSEDKLVQGWRVSAYGSMLLTLQSDSLTEEEFMALCRRTGLLQELVDRLLRTGRIDEAITTATTASDYELLSLADLFVSFGHPNIAEELIWERAGTSKDARLERWLQKQAAASGDWQKAVAYAVSQFWQDPRLVGYQEVQALATKAGEWPERHQVILARLADEQHHQLLTRIYLLEEEIEAALASLSHVKYPAYLTVEVAEAAEADHPREALHLYVDQIERLIAARGRDNYALAATFLLRVQDLYERLEEPQNWQKYLHSVRNHKPRLPAMLEELGKVGL